MALKRLVIDGYGQIELNNCAFRRDGRVEAQCALDETDFATDACENGMLLAVDNVARVVKYPTNDSLPIALVYSAEHIYDERAAGLKNFKLNLGEFLPRLGYLSVGDKWTENCVCYDDGEFADDDAFVKAVKNVATTPLYGGISANGAIKVSATKPTVGPVLLVVKNFANDSMPDGQFGIKFQCLQA